MVVMTDKTEVEDGNNLNRTLTLFSKFKVGISVDVDGINYRSGIRSRYRKWMKAENRGISDEGENKSWYGSRVNDGGNELQEQAAFTEIPAKKR